MVKERNLMGERIWLAAALLCGFVSLFASSVIAAPILFAVTGGTASISVVVDGVEIGSAENVAVSGSLTLDNAAHSLDLLSIALDPNVVLNLSSAYGGYDQITIEAASIVSDAGFGPTLPSVVNSPNSFTAFVGSLTVSGTWAGTDSTGVNSPVSNIPIAFPVPTFTAVIGTNNPTISIEGVTLNALNGATFGEPRDLVVLASFTMFAVPEPRTGMLVMLGMTLLARSRRRAQPRRAC